MTSKGARPRWPFKGPIFMYAVFALGLASASRFVDRQVERLHGAQGLKEAWVQHDLSVAGPGALGPASGAGLEADLAQYLPLAGLDLTGIGIAASLGAGAQHPRVDALGGQGRTTGLSSGPMTGPATGPLAGPVIGADASSVLREWTFLMTPEQRRAHRGHGAPHARLEVGVNSWALGAVGHGAPPSARPCGLSFQLVDEAGRELDLAALGVTQTGADGDVRPSAYRSAEGEGRWTGGSSALTPGACAHFALVGSDADGSRWAGATLGRAPLRGSLDLGRIVMRPSVD